MVRLRETVGWPRVEVAQGLHLLLVALHSSAPANPALSAEAPALCSPFSLEGPASRLLVLAEAGSLPLGRHSLAPSLRQGWASPSQP